MILLKTGTTTSKNALAFLLTPRNQVDSKSYTFAADNGTTNFGEVKNGTPLGLDSDSKARPCGNGGVNGVVAASATVIMEDGEAANFYAADDVQLVSTLGVAGTGTMTDLTAGGDDIALEGITNNSLAHTVTLVDPAADKEEITVSIVWAGDPENSVATIVATLGYSSAAIDSTIQELANAINTEAGWLVEAVVVGTGTNVIDDAAVTGTLSGGAAAGGVLDASNIIVSVNKTTHTVVLTDVATLADGDKMQLVNGATPVAILDVPHSTSLRQFDDDGEAIHADQHAKGLVGPMRVTSANITGNSVAIRAALPLVTFE